MANRTGAETSPSPLRVLWVVSEMSPLASTGGLAEVAGSLPTALQGCAVTADVLMPLYRVVRERHADELAALGEPFELPLGELSLPARLWELRRESSHRVLLLDVEELYEREGIYADAEGDHPDNALRFVALGHAALRVLETARPPYDLLHAHDWPAASALILLAWNRPANPKLRNVRSVFSLHNPAYQGLYSKEDLAGAGLPPALVDSAVMRLGDETSLLKGGWELADSLATVSEPFARELRAGRRGFGLEESFRARGKELVGILNGIDDTDYDPRTDPRLPEPFDPKHLEGKRAAKRLLQEEYQLEISEKSPLLGYLGRLAEQKGVDLLLDSAGDLLRSGAQLILLGDGDPELAARIETLRDANPGRVGAYLGYDAQRSRRLLAGLDLLLMPSRYEPCGIAQMQAMRYGTLCLVHAVGGLSASIENADAEGLRGNGFLFRTHSRRALLQALRRALRLWRLPGRWRKMQQRAMKTDFSWGRSARLYAELYRSTLSQGPRSLPPEVGQAAPGIPRRLQRVAQRFRAILGEAPTEPELELIASGPRRLYAYWRMPDGESAERSDADLRLQLWQNESLRANQAGLPAAGQSWLLASPGRPYRARLLDEEGRELATTPLRRTPPETQPPGPGGSPTGADLRRGTRS